MLAYKEAARYRLGSNFEQIPINCPRRSYVDNYGRDGQYQYNGNEGNGVNFFKNSLNGPKEDPFAAEDGDLIEGIVAR